MKLKNQIPNNHLLLSHSNDIYKHQPIDYNTTANTTRQTTTANKRKRFSKKALDGYSFLFDEYGRVVSMVN